MHHKFWIRIVENSLIATMICRKCGHKLPFATQIEPDEDEEEEEEPTYYPFGGARRKRRGLDIDHMTPEEPHAIANLIRYMWERDLTRGLRRRTARR
jgi:hypothetical protein